MVCPFCMNPKTEIYNSRQTKKLNQVWRRRRCLTCDKVFTTTEAIDLSSIFKVRSGINKAETYKQGVLLASLLKACDHRSDQAAASFYLLSICEEALQRAAQDQTISTETLGKTVARIVERFDTVAWAKYCSYHNVAFKKARLKQG